MRRATRPVHDRAGPGRAAAAVLAVAVAAVLGLAVTNGADVARVGADDVDTADASAQARAPATMSRLAARIAAPWVDRRAESGLFVDPLTGGSGAGYGPAMMAEVLMRAGARRGDRRMLRAGLKVLSVDASRAAADGRPGNPLELLAIASAYRWAEHNLSGHDDWRRWSRGPRTYLRTWESAGVGAAARTCFASTSCWNNYKIVDAAAVLLLLESGLEPASESSRLADPRAARAAALSTLTRDLPRAIGRRAAARTARGSLTALGTLADEPNRPLAYHAMSVAALARALQVLGDRAPPAARESFRRAMLAQASFMAPDGDVTYLGRAQGESWALAATAYAGQSCARLFQRSHPRSAAMCATLALRALRRLKRLYGFRHGVLAIVPRFGHAQPTVDGLEHYARVMTFNGLTGVFLEWASDAAKAAASVRPIPLPLDAGGSFVDPDRSRIAVVRRSSVWFAVHATGPVGVDDLRYDFGLLALKFRRANRWVDVTPQRPYDDRATPDGGGPALVTPYGLAFPRGKRFSVDAGSGEVTVRGGYRTAAGVWALRGVDFRFRPSRRGVTVIAQAPAGSALRFQDFVPSPWTEVADGGSLLRSPTAVSRLSVTPYALEQGPVTASSNSTQLRGYRRYATVPADGRISWTLASRRLRAGTPARSPAG